jgi:ATP-dependent DNA helicase RecQ
MARVKPLTNESFRTITGVGDHKLEKYGPEFIAAIQTFLDE